MSSVQGNATNFNTNIFYNFLGGNLSSDSGLLPIRSFIEKLGLRLLLETYFNDSVNRKHCQASIIEQLIYQSIAGYPTDYASNSLRHDPIFTKILGKDSLASQPTISRFVNELDESAIDSFNRLLEILFEKGNPVKSTKQIVLDLDSTLFETFGKQDGSSFNFHYSSNGYHPLMLFNGLNGDLMKVELRDGSVYTSNGIKEFLKPVLKWLKKQYPAAHLIVRADSGFATPDLYDLCDDMDVEILVRLKANATLRKLSEEAVHDFMETFGADYSRHHVMYDEFSYQAKSWCQPMRVICRVERPAGELLPRATYIVTSLSAEPKIVVRAYNKRGNMENFIKEAKIDFAMESTSHSSFMANAVKTLIKALAYSIVNIMKRTVLPKDMKRSRMLSIRSSLVKIACRAVTSARRTIFQLCSHYPYKDDFYQIMREIDKLQFA